MLKPSVRFCEKATSLSSGHFKLPVQSPVICSRASRDEWGN